MRYKVEKALNKKEMGEKNRERELLVVITSAYFQPFSLFSAFFCSPFLSFFPFPTSLCIHLSISIPVYIDFYIVRIYCMVYTGVFVGVISKVKFVSCH